MITGREVASNNQPSVTKTTIAEEIFDIVDPIRDNMTCFKDFRLERMLYDVTFHDGAMEQYRMLLGDLRVLLDENFSFVQDNPLAVPWEPVEEHAQRRKNLKEFYAYINEPEISPAGNDGESDVNVTEENVYKKSKSDEDLQKRFEFYLKKQPARGSSSLLGDVSIQNYMRAVFSSSSSSFKSLLQLTFGKTFQLYQLMFNPEGTTKLLPVELVTELLTFPPSETGASARQMAMVGAFHLLNYFTYCLAIDNTELTLNTAHSTSLNTYERKMKKCIEMISKRLHGLAELSKKQAKVKKNRANHLNPELKRLKEEATSKWFASDHMKNNLDKLKTMAFAAKRKGEVPTPEEFSNAARFCMLIVNYYNGSRRQAAEILTNRHVLQRQRAYFDSNEAIQLDTNLITTKVNHTSPFLYPIICI